MELRSDFLLYDDLQKLQYRTTPVEVGPKLSPRIVHPPPEISASCRWPLVS